MALAQSHTSSDADSLDGLSGPLQFAAIGPGVTTQLRIADVYKKSGEPGVLFVLHLYAYKLGLEHELQESSSIQDACTTARAEGAQPTSDAPAWKADFFQAVLVRMSVALYELLARDTERVLEPEPLPLTWKSPSDSLDTKLASACEDRFGWSHDTAAAVSQKLVFVAPSDIEAELDTPIPGNELLASAWTHSDSFVRARRATSDSQFDTSYRVSDIHSSVFDSSQPSSKQVSGRSDVMAPRGSPAPPPNPETPRAPDAPPIPPLIPRLAGRDSDSSNHLPAQHDMQGLRQRLLLSKEVVQSWINMPAAVTPRQESQISNSQSSCVLSGSSAKQNIPSTASNERPARGAVPQCMLSTASDTERSASVDSRRERSSVASYVTTAPSRSFDPTLTLSSMHTADASQRLFQQGHAVLTDLAALLTSHDYLLLVHLAGNAGACRTLLKYVSKLTACWPGRALCVRLIVQPSLVGLNRLIRSLGFTCWASSYVRSNCVLAPLFSVSASPRALVVDCAAGEVCCADAVKQIQHVGRHPQMPWRDPVWRDLFKEALEQALASSSSWTDWGSWHDRAVALIDLSNKFKRPPEFCSNLALWLSMYVQGDVLCCYTSPDSAPIPEFADHVPLDNDLLKAADPNWTSEYGCSVSLLAAPDYYETLSLDMSDLGLDAAPWQLPDDILSQHVHKMSALQYRRLHSCPLFLAVSSMAMVDALGGTCREAVALLHSKRRRRQRPGRNSLMYATMAHDDPALPDAFLNLVYDNLGDNEQLEGTCYLFIFSFIAMTVVKVKCSDRLPTPAFVKNFLCAYFAGHVHKAPMTTSL